MSTSTDTLRGARKAQTYLPGAGAREELLDFAEFMRKLEVYLAQNSSKAALVDPHGKARPIPDEIFRILDQVMNALAPDEGITVVPQGMTMTTQQAADFLVISRPTLVRLLEAGDIAYDKPAVIVVFDWKTWRPTKRSSEPSAGQRCESCSAPASGRRFQSVARLTSSVLRSLTRK